MRIAQRLGAIARPPPAVITERALRRRRHAGTPANAALNTAAHLAFGAVMGFVFAAGRKRFAMRLPAPLAGALFGLGVWATHYEAVLPALRLLPPAHRDSAGRRATMVVAHLVYGSVLGYLVGAAPPARGRHGVDGDAARS